MRLTPTPNQEALIQRVLSERTQRALNGSELGTGKTLVAAELMHRTGSKVNLITAPLHTLDGWIKAVDGQMGQELRFANNKTKAGKIALEELRWGKTGTYFVGREYARLQDWSSVGLDFWVSDECHSWAKRGTRGHKSAVKMNADWKVAQSATWFGSTFENAWGVPRALWPETITASWYVWRNLWCKTEYDHFAPGNLKVVGEKHPGKWAGSLPCYVKIESDLSEVEPVEVHYDLSATQRKMYKQMEEQGLAWLEDNPLAAELPITQRIRLREITLAEPSLNADGEVFYAPDAKSSLLNVVTDLLGDLIGEQVLMGTHSAKFARYLADRLGSGAFAWTGDKTDTVRAKAKADFISSRLQYIVATQKSIGEGVDGLQAVSHVLFELSQDDSPIMNRQFRGRLNRRGQSKPVVAFRFIARHTLEDKQHKSLLQKELEMRRSMVK